MEMTCIVFHCSDRLNLSHTLHKSKEKDDGSVTGAKPGDVDLRNTDKEASLLLFHTFHINEYIL